MENQRKGRAVANRQGVPVRLLEGGEENETVISLKACQKAVNSHVYIQTSRIDQRRYKKSGENKAVTNTILNEIAIARLQSRNLDCYSGISGSLRPGKSNKIAIVASKILTV